MAVVVVSIVGMSGAASAQLGQFVQAFVDAQIKDGKECRERPIYTVPAGKRLRIDWMSVEVLEFGGDDFDPVDVHVKTRLGGVTRTHALVRIDDALFVGTSFFKTQLWSSPVTLYSQGGLPVLVRACRNNATDETLVWITLHGQLFDE